MMAGRSGVGLNESTRVRASSGEFLAATFHLPSLIIILGGSRCR